MFPQLPLTEFLIGCIFSNDPLDRQGFDRLRSSSAQGDIGSVPLPPLPDIATTCSLSSSSLDCDDLVRTLAPRVLLQPPPGLEQDAPGLAIDAHLCTPHGIPVKAAPLRPRLRSAISLTPPQPPACTIHVGTHHARSATTGKRSASTALAGTHNLVGTDPRAGTGPFPKPRALVFPLVHFGQSKPDGHGYIDTADSDLMHHQYRLSVLQWNPGPARSNPTISSQRLADGFMRLFFKKPVIMFRTSPISSLRTLATRTSLSCSTRTHLSLTPWCLLSRKTPQAKVRGVWSCSSFEVSCDVHLSLDHRLLLFAQCTFTMSWLRNVMHLLSSSSAFMDI